MAALCSGVWGAADPAWAADKPELAPPGAWVQRMDPPKPPKDAEAAPGRILLMDRQTRFGPEGDELYIHMAVQLLTPEGLQGANVNLDWHPDFETLVLHRIRILRGDKVIDVLAQEEPFTVLRRESSLERAKLDGKLTAAMQPEGLEVGDILDVEMTMRRHDRIMGDRSELVEQMPPAEMKIISARQRLVWPSTKSVRWRATADLKVNETRTADGVELIVEARDGGSTPAPDGAPSRFQRARQIELTDFKSWEDASAALAPFWDSAVTLKPDSPLKTEAAKIAASTTDLKARADAALRLVEEKTRYVYIGINYGGYVPAGADLTWSRRFGDCKGKAVLLAALLRELGVQAEPVVVSTTGGDGIDERLPALEYFNHAIVRATIAGKVYWLDATRTFDHNIDAIDPPGYRWALPIRTGGAHLEKIDQPAFTVPHNDTVVRIDATGGLDGLAPAHAEAVLRGDEAAELNARLANQSKDEAEAAAKVHLMGAGLSDIRTVTFGYDKATGEEHIVGDGSARLSWFRPDEGGVRRLIPRGSGLGDEDASFERKPPRPKDAKGKEIKTAPLPTDWPGKDAPYAVAHPNYSRSVSIVTLPRSGAGFALTGGDVDQTIAATQYRRVSKLERGVLTVEASTRSLAAEFPASQAAAAAKALVALADQDFYLAAPADWRDGPGENAVRIARKPVSADEFLDHADAAIAANDYDLSMADFDAALKLEPELTQAFNDRCFARARANRALDLAAADCAKALEAEPKSANILDSRAFLQFRLGHMDEALKDYEEALKQSSRQSSSLFMRGVIRRSKGQTAEGDADITAALAINPYVAERYAKFGVKP